MKIQTKKLKNGFCFTLSGKEYTCTTEKIAYFKLTKDLSFSPETDILISTDRFMPDAQEQLDKYAVIKVVSNKNMTQRNTDLFEYKFHGIPTDEIESRGILCKISLYRNNRRYNGKQFRDIFRLTLKFLE